MNLVLEVLWGWLWNHVVNVMDLRCARVVVGLLDRVRSLGRGFGGLRVMGMVGLLFLLSDLCWPFALMMTLKAPSALVRLALAV